MKKAWVSSESLHCLNALFSCSSGAMANLPYTINCSLPWWIGSAPSLVRRVIKYTATGSLPVFKAEKLAQLWGSEYTTLQAELWETNDFHGQEHACETLSGVLEPQTELRSLPHLRMSQMCNSISVDDECHSCIWLPPRKTWSIIPAAVLSHLAQQAVVQVCS